MSASSIAIIDYGMGNLHSVASALSHVSPDSDIKISSDKSVIESADRVIFPGVGGIRDCIAEIHRLGFDQLVPEIIASGKPVLGICVGMQALLQASDENDGVDCIGELPGRVRFFGEPLFDTDGSKLKVPHMGWNNVEQLIDHPLWQKIDNQSRFYFVHSYFVDAEDDSQIVGRCVYGKPFAAAMARKNLFVTQFHPEKSHTAGLQLLKNFVSWNGED